MKENIKEKLPVQKFKLTPITSKNDINYIKEPNIKIDTQNKKVKFLTKKKEFFQTKKCSETNKKKLKNSNFNEGRWKKDENNQFILGITLYGNNWKKVKSLIRTRTAIQVRSHAQKFFKRMKLCKNDKLGIDFTLDSINNINDMIKQIKLTNPNYDTINIFKELSNNSNIKSTCKSSKKKNKLNNNEDKINISIINDNQNIIINEEKEKENQNLINNNITNNKNIDLFHFNNIQNNNIININNNNQQLLNNSFQLNTKNNFPINNNVLNSNIYNNLLKYYLSLNYNNLLFINSLYQIDLLFKPIENMYLFNMINNNNLINILNRNNPNNNNIPSDNLFYQLNQQNQNNNFDNQQK